MWHRTIVRLAERTDVHPALKKMWKKHYKVDGQVSQHLSPFEQHINKSWLKELPAKFVKKVTEGILEAGPGLGLGFAILYWGEWKHKDIAYHHRA